jgi:hypothetical protein
MGRCREERPSAVAVDSMQVRSDTVRTPVLANALDLKELGFHLRPVGQHVLILIQGALTYSIPKDLKNEGKIDEPKEPNSELRHQKILATLRNCQVPLTEAQVRYEVAIMREGSPHRASERPCCAHICAKVPIQKSGRKVERRCS